MNKVYKIVYLEDQEADSIIHELKTCHFKVFHCIPSSFEETLDKIKKEEPDLILMDFRLKETGGKIDAPSFAQYFRSTAVDKKIMPLPIVLLSNDQVINDYYKDFTSHDLFDFSINKGRFSSELIKYTHLMTELIVAYESINYLLKRPNSNLNSLLNIPNDFEKKLDPRLFEQLNSKKNLSDVYMASSFILNQIVKPIGVLIGEDVLSARLGISKDSSQWNELCELLEVYKYKGCFSKAYMRWWAIGLEDWWGEQFNEKPSLKRLTAEERYHAVKGKFGLEIKPIENQTERTWNICNKEKTPIDSMTAFEMIQEENTPPWQDKNYYSFNGLLESKIDTLKLIKDFDRERYIDKAKNTK